MGTIIDDRAKFTLTPSGWGVIIERFEPGNDGTLPPGTHGVMRRVTVPLADLLRFAFNLPLSAFENLTEEFTIEKTVIQSSGSTSVHLAHGE